MSPPSSTHLDTLRLAPPLRAYATGLAADANEAHFFIHSAVLAAFCSPVLSPRPTEASLRADIARRAVRVTAARS